MRAILIDPEQKEIKEIDWDGTFDGSNGAYKHLGCEMVQMAHERGFPVSERMLIDEDALYKSIPKFRFFLESGVLGPLINKTMLVGVYRSTFKDVETTVESLLQRVIWLTKA